MSQVLNDDDIKTEWRRPMEGLAAQVGFAADPDQPDDDGAEDDSGPIDPADDDVSAE